jgi:hypothetical protein
MEVAPTPGRATPHPVPAADATALSLVFLLIFCVACFAWGAAILGRRERKVMESDGTASSSADDSAQTPKHGNAGESRSAWEREPDWWKR